MMPDLGRYAVEVLSTWGISLGLVGLLIWQSLRRARRVRDELARIERGGE
ncbi:MAG: heme exporter protein CcmD [Rubellimicrobium sp.]|nr:heme exporter protein CcmD [Rubellimicrobium sp.]